MTTNHRESQPSKNRKIAPQDNYAIVVFKAVGKKKQRTIEMVLLQWLVFPGGRMKRWQEAK
jgi:hypothetical protein